MSFLANLRQQHSDKQSLCLCYLVSYDTFNHQLQLDLGLYDQAQAPIHSLQPYKLQREHLHTPPGFFTKMDQEILKELAQLNTSRLDNHQLELSSSLTWLLLKAIIETGHCYFSHGYFSHSYFENKSAKHNLKPVKVGTYQMAQASWLLAPSADYKLRWHLPDCTSARCIPLQHDLIYIRSDAAQVVLGCTNNIMDQTEGRNYWQWQQLRFPACKLPDHLEKQSNIPLPLPSPPTIHTMAGQLQAILRCEPGRDGNGLIKLWFTISNNQYCSIPRNLAEPADFTEYYWDGHQLYQLTADSAHYTVLKNAIGTLLDDFKYDSSSTCTWRPHNPSQWQALFIDRYDQLQALGVGFSFDKQFKHRYVASKGWDVQLDDSNKEAIGLTIALHTQESVIPLQDILSQLREYNLQNQEGHCQLPLTDGRILLLPKREAKGLLEELEGLEFSTDGFHLDRAQRYRLAGLQATLEDKAEWGGDLDTLQQAIAVNQSPVVLDSHFAAVNAELRPYQWLGVCWIHHLKKHGFNGLLADDMGLGKTLQAITLLAFEKQQGLITSPALVVVPLTLVHNWVAEIERFAPQLKVHVMHGSKRHEQWSKLKGFDILITTYQSACLDLGEWQQQALSWLILDEAQQIKNPSTRWSQALREIPCDNKLCLSGTPVENHLGELWSIMDFLMPGCLGSQKYFRHYFRKAIEVEGNGERMTQLLNRVAPFMLRRTKDQIAKDLPLKTEIVRRIELDQSQRNFYETIKSDAWLELQTTLDDPSQKGKNRIAALTALLKLRQACCDPALFPSERIPSAKKDYCIDMIDELVAEGRAVLVFSQFTQMLDLLREALDQRQIPSLTLTGSSRKRDKIVDAFQKGKAPVFLISLKAGGTGLNLTRADTVIHYDPWWNAAAEKQASDRAHRIGQDKPVFVYKLIAADTIEEKVEHLQQQKIILSEHVDQQAQITADSFALKFEELLSLFHEDAK